MVTLEEIENKKRGKFSQYTAQIFKDCLYVYGYVESRSYWDQSVKQLWSFDLTS